MSTSNPIDIAGEHRIAALELPPPPHVETHEARKLEQEKRETQRPKFAPPKPSRVGNQKIGYVNQPRAKGFNQAKSEIRANKQTLKTHAA